MTSDFTNLPFDFDTVDDERLSYLFALAVARHKNRPADLSNLSEEDVTILNEVVLILQTIDASWQSAPAELDRGRAIFLKKLAAEEPTHPWVRQSTVATLGDLFQASQDEFPSVPEATAEALYRDPTRIENLLDVSTRTELLGKALRTAAVPVMVIRDFVMGINRILGSISAISNSPGQGFVYARRQHSTKRKTNAAEAETDDKG